MQKVFDLIPFLFLKQTFHSANEPVLDEKVLSVHLQPQGKMPLASLKVIQKAPFYRPRT